MKSIEKLHEELAELERIYKSSSKIDKSLQKSIDKLKETILNENNKLLINKELEINDLSNDIRYILTESVDENEEIIQLEKQENVNHSPTRKNNKNLRNTVVEFTKLTVGMAITGIIVQATSPSKTSYSNFRSKIGTAMVLDEQFTSLDSKEN